MDGISLPKNHANALTAPITPEKRLPHVDRSKANPEDVKAAEGMEALFLDYMMKVMRETVPKDEMDLENKGTEIYRGMLDSEVAERAARAGGIGLADQIIAYLQAQRYNHDDGVHRGASPDSSTGGTYEGRPDRK